MASATFLLQVYWPPLSVSKKFLISPGDTPGEIVSKNVKAPPFHVKGSAILVLSQTRDGNLSPLARRINIVRISWFRTELTVSFLLIPL